MASAAAPWKPHLPKEAPLVKILQQLAEENVKIMPANLRPVAEAALRNRQYLYNYLSAYHSGKKHAPLALVRPPKIH